MKNDVSCIHSLASPFEYNPSKVGGFECLGYGSQGEYHVAVFFRNIVSSVMQANVTTPLLITKTAAVYELHGAKGGTIYGLLFSVDRDKLQLRNTHLTVRSDREPIGDFSLFPISSDRYAVQIYVDSADTLLINQGTIHSSLVVVDE